MSFQHFRLGEVTPIHHLQQTSTQSIPAATSISATKQPYGSGDSEDGYTLVFASLEEFQTWRQAEEERNCVEFVKGDTHGSKADPPRFKEHTKLVCARHSRSGRKKYVKKHPDRVRKVPSRKLEGTGCQASISYKTYFDSDQVRACCKIRCPCMTFFPEYRSPDIQQHSHPVGPDNLPYTRRGRKAVALAEKDRSRNKGVAAGGATALPSPDQSQMSIASPSSSTQSSSTVVQPPSSFSSAVSMLAPLPGQTFPATPQAPTYNYPATVEYGMQVPNQNQERWNNMGTLFQTVRDHARTYNYPAASVAALETVLIRLFLESPIGAMPPGMVNSGITANSAQAQPGVQMQTAVNGQTSMSGSNTDTTTES